LFLCQLHGFLEQFLGANVVGHHACSFITTLQFVLSEEDGIGRGECQEASPAVAAAAHSGSLNAACSRASFSKRYDSITLATTSGKFSSHGTVSTISSPATARGPV